ncbi:hypothetical protein JHK82_018796 [Glycine max]|uniref:Uncharacterized protein n=1 Tax=Glycine max TaxID=3847 RepID=A0A0R0JAT8_SOYBN|nr:hypothetical protein JHK87_018689 [Glycine soja]KAG5022896.1 hypothetical protein JHK85_019238 [Glycine max]KAG5143101.1 hypothetical protein JHK82_018796 [Glycine max]KAH1087139.1 hypothetical protein GYH30_018605 [Glycine max]KRH49557.1 hypothetical protein GLYMA_07G163000v4 [Glycine max]
MVATSNSTEGSNLSNVVTATKLLEFNGKRLAYFPSLQPETKKLWETQLIIPFSLAEKSWSLMERDLLLLQA